jgi:hypothetical protein
LESKIDGTTIFLAMLFKEDVMDSITAAIVAALAAGAASGLTTVGEQAISDAYSKLKALLGKKFGGKSRVVKAVKELETNPKSAGRKEVVKEEVAAAKADQDEELLELARSLLDDLQALPGGSQIIQAAMGDQNIQVAGDGNTVSMGTSKNKK